MDPYKIHVRLGQYEFNGEGPIDTVKAAYDQFLVVVANRALKEPLRNSQSQSEAKSEASYEPGVDQSILSQIFKVDEASGVVSLRSLPTGENGNRAADAALLLIYGYNKLQGASEVPVTKLLAGLRESGVTVDRFDRTISLHGGLILKGGQKIGAKYRLNNQGAQKAESMTKTFFG